MSAVSSGTAALHLSVRASGIERGDRVVTSPFSFVASANCVVYEGAEPVFCDIDPRTLNVDPAAASAAIDDRTVGLLPVHIFGYPADMAAFEALASERGLWIVEDACEALGAVHGDGPPVGARGNLATFGFYPNKQITTGEGGAVVCPSPEVAARIDSERNQGRAPDMGWLDHDRLGFNYRLDDLSCALGVAQVERLDQLLGRPRPGGRALRRGAGRDRGAGAAVPGLRAATAAPGSCTWSSCPAGSTATPWWCELRERGVDSKPYLPAIHLNAFYRERFGHREGEFPVCEDVAARSLALPFFGSLSEGEVAQVAEALPARCCRRLLASGLTSDTKPGSPPVPGREATSSKPARR